MDPDSINGFHRLFEGAHGVSAKWSVWIELLGKESKGSHSKFAAIPEMEVGTDR